MKIAILSMQRVENHGSFLQSYALKSVLEQQGHQVSFLDIKKGELLTLEEADEYHSENGRRSLKELVQRFRVKVKNVKQRKIFQNEQREFLKLSDEYNYDEPCDATVIGSDEVFNCTTNAKWGLSTQLFGEIPNAGKVITYAASCGGTTYESIPAKYHEKIGSALNQLAGISVRDKNTKLFVEKYRKAIIEEHLDPVFMYDFHKEIKVPEISFPYVLIYSYNNRIHKKEEIEAIKNFAKKRNLKTVGAGIFQYWCDYNIPAESFEVLGYFKEADYVVTDTFHGSVMSIKFNKDFTVLVRESNRNKLEDLLSKFHLEGRCISRPSELEENAKRSIEYSSVNRKIEEEQLKTLDYLKQNL